MRRLAEPAALCLITGAAVLVHGYHLGVDDAEIYTPAIEKVANPALFPYNTAFFDHHAQLSLFPNLIGLSSRLTHMPSDAAVFLWHCLAILLTLVAIHRLLGCCFDSAHARWAGTALLAATLTVPVAGTALVIMDPYLTARSLSTPFTIFAIAEVAGGRHRRAALWTLATALVHPQMAVYLLTFCGVFAAVKRTERARVGAAAAMSAAAVLPIWSGLTPATGVYQQILHSRTYFFVSNWSFWEWAGIWMPLLLLWTISKLRAPNIRPVFTQLCRALIGLGIVSTVAALVINSSVHFETLARLQPMRSFHIFYALMFAFLGALLGEYVLCRKIWRWTLLFVPLAIGMMAVQFFQWPASAHIELPGVAYRSGLPAAFQWIRENTPNNAMFALDPAYLAINGDDEHGFRTIAERSALADSLKDSGAVSLFPQLASEWRAQVRARQNWAHFGAADFRRLERRYGVNWVVISRSQPAAGLSCVFQNYAARVCRITAK